MSDRRDPFGAFYFTVEIYGENLSYPFRSCSGLRDESTVVEISEGGRLHPHKRIGEVKYPNLVLKRGFCMATSELYKLRQAAKNNIPASPNNSPRFSGVITQLGSGSARARWRFLGGWICKWEGPDLDASKNEISIESIEIAHEGLEMLKEKPAT
ncbi:MAG TPA: phage tail protein [Polyangia bacterium]|nr:phage tail protein [Polyangia bacterium]